MSFSLSGNKPLSARLINAFFQVKLKLPLSKLISTLKVIIDFATFAQRNVALIRPYLLEILSFALWLGLEFYGSMAKCCFWA